MCESTYLTDQQSLPLRPIKQETRLVLSALNNPHTLLSLRDVSPNHERFDALLSAGLVGVDEDVTTST